MRLRALTWVWRPPTAVVASALALTTVCHRDAAFLNPHGTPPGPGAALEFFGDLALGILAGTIVWRSGSLPLATGPHWLFDWSPWRFYLVGLGVAEGMRGLTAPAG